MNTLTLREKTVVEVLVGEEILNLNIPIFKRFIHNNIIIYLYHVKGYERMIKRTNNIVQLQNKEFLSLTHMIVNTAVSNKQLCVFLGLKLHCTGESLSRDIEISITSNSIFSIVEQTHSCVAVFPELLFKKFFITPHPNDRRKFCCFPLVNSLETD
ncbi:unnamed protein product [Lasius platythorax]|uniref:Uncharacterized protein n=1 Tax=Lasius platythorax TaxID=488582 RepID=A0AAV2MY00_9HYME